MKRVHTKHITVDLHYTGKEFDYLIDVVIKLNGEYHSNYHIKDINDLPDILHSTHLNK